MNVECENCNKIFKLEYDKTLYVDAETSGCECCSPVVDEIFARCPHCGHEELIYKEEQAK